MVEMFQTRASLHQRAYQHRTSSLSEIMIAEAMAMADAHVTLHGVGGRPCRMSQCTSDMNAYTMLSDWILRSIEFSTEPALQDSRGLLARLRRRCYYKLVGECELPSRYAASADGRERVVRDMGLDASFVVDVADFGCDVVWSEIPFCTKQGVVVVDVPPRHVEVPPPLVRVWSRDVTAPVDAARARFEAWSVR